MSVRATARVVGFEEMKRLLHLLPDEVKIKALGSSVRKMGQLTLEKAKAYAPEGETGALKRNIRLIRAKRTSGPWHVAYGLAVKTARKKTKRLGFMEGFFEGEKSAKAKGANDPYYWFFLEFGTVHIKPERRFLRKALEAHREQHVELFKQEFGKKLDAVARKMRAGSRLPKFASMSARR